ncbi:MAG: serine/threonine protein kinase [Oscillospiraceae bacterium]|nr:serine/threonine protein kinase [Oscillospiraceae bacterium]
MTGLELKNKVLTDFALVGALPAREGETLLLRHKTQNKRAVLRFFARENPVFVFLRGVTHPNLPAVYDVYSLSDGFAALTEYVDGLTAAEVLESGPYTYAGAKKVLSGVGAALSVLHENGFVHRDVKPENVVIGENGRVVLIDFDIARPAGRPGTQTRALGTLGYAPPEQQGIGESDSRSDIYALGVLLNVLLTGRHPSVSLAPGRAGKLVLRCTAVSPEKRFQSVEEFLSRL